jgi:hypothetical protein
VFVADLDFSPILSVGDKSFSIALDLAHSRFDMLAVLWVHNAHGGEASWGRWGEVAAWQHGHRQPVKRHGGRAR